MNNIKYILLISTCLLLPKESQAEINLTFDASNFIFSNPTLHTHHTPVELKPISVVSNHGIKLAATCFLPHCRGNGNYDFSDNDYGFDEQYLCNDKGYNLSSCSVNQSPQDFCPDSNKYFKRCICNEEFQYSLSSCQSNFYNSVLGSEQCASEGNTYSNSCICDTVKYPYTTSNCTGNESLSGTICKSSNGITYGSTCTCTPTSGKCSGYNLNSDTCGGGSSIGESCHDGCETKWRCKDLCPYKGTLTSCPNGYVCTLEECSSKFYISGCGSNYEFMCTGKYEYAPGDDSCNSRYTYCNCESGYTWKFYLSSYNCCASSGCSFPNYGGCRCRPCGDEWSFTCPSGFSSSYSCYSSSWINDPNNRATGTWISECSAMATPPICIRYYDNGGGFNEVC